MRQTTTLVVFALTLALCAGTATAQIAADTLKVDYFSNANGGLPDGTLRLTNPGTAPANVCADIFVFDPNQEMSECCSCLLTPDGLRTLSVNTDVTSNPLTGKGSILTTGLLKIVSSKLVNGKCPLPTAFTPTAALRAWTTHIQAGGAETETGSLDATLSSTELSRLQAECHAIGLDGSGAGVCSCGTGE